MNEIMVGELSEFTEGGYRVLRVDDFEFGIFRQGDRLVAYENHCPHDGGPVCQGKVIPRVEEELAPDQTSRGLRFAKSKNIVCPWHGWEFDIETGRHCGDPKYRLRRSTSASRARQPRLERTGGELSDGIQCLPPVVPARRPGADHSRDWIQMPTRRRRSERLHVTHSP